MSFEIVNGVYIPTRHIFGEIKTDMTVVRPGDVIEGFDNGAQGLKQVDRATGALARVAFANAVLGNHMEPVDNQWTNSWQFSAEEDERAINRGNGDMPVVRPWPLKSKMPSEEMRRNSYNGGFENFSVTSLGGIAYEDPGLTRPFNVLLAADMISTKQRKDSGRVAIIMSGVKTIQRSGSARTTLNYLRLSEDTSKQWAEQLVTKSSEDARKAAVANLRHVIVNGFHN